MTERWVCKRCFADNEPTDSACNRCGLIRGAEATETDQAGWAARPAATETAGPGWQRFLRFWWVPAIAVVLLVGYFTAAQRGDDGSLTSAGTVPVDDLRPGDCFNAGDEEEIADVDGVPCDEPHEYEVYAIEQYEGSTFPDDAEMDVIFETICAPAFASYVGTSYESSVLRASMITPSEETWNDGDREFICYLFEPVDDSLTANVSLTESMRGAGR